MSDPLLRVENLFHTYIQGGKAIPVLQGVSFALQRGQCAALMGESGSGKSTLLALLGLLMPCQQGKIWLESNACHTLNDMQSTTMRRKHLGFVYQYHHLANDLTAVENVMLPLWLQGSSQKHALGQAEAWLDALALRERTNAFPDTLSGGERQRVAIARSLVHRPKVVLADEPTGNLDEATGSRVFQLLLHAARETGCSIIMATHNISLGSLCDRKFYLTQGKLEEISC